MKEQVSLSDKILNSGTKAVYLESNNSWEGFNISLFMKSKYCLVNSNSGKRLISMGAHLLKGQNNQKQDCQEAQFQFSHPAHYLKWSQEDKSN